MSGTINRVFSDIGIGSLKKVSSQTTHGTPGTQTTHAHGLTDIAGNAIAPTIAIPVMTADFASGVAVEAIDATNVTCTSTTASVTFDLYVG